MTMACPYRHCRLPHPWPRGTPGNYHFTHWDSRRARSLHLGVSEGTDWRDSRSFALEKKAASFPFEGSLGAPKRWTDWRTKERKKERTHGTKRKLLLVLGCRRLRTQSFNEPILGAPVTFKRVLVQYCSFLSFARTGESTAAFGIGGAEGEGGDDDELGRSFSSFRRRRRPQVNRNAKDDASKRKTNDETRTKTILYCYLYITCTSIHRQASYA